MMHRPVKEPVGAGKWNCRRAPLAVSLVFLLFFLVFDLAFPSSIWVGDDNVYLTLANGLNLSARLSDLAFYPAASMMYHPGVPFYFASWFSFVASGNEFAGSDARFLASTFDHADSIFAAARIIASAITALSILLYMKVTAKVVPTIAAVWGLVAWIAASPNSLVSSVFLSNETFALLANALLLWCAVCFLRGKVRLGHYAVFGAVAAFGYLIKLNYLYIYVSLLIGIVHYCTFSVRRFSAVLKALLIYHCSLAAVIYLVGYGIIGEAPFNWLLEFHWRVFSHSGLYGSGELESAAFPEILRAVIHSIRDLNIGILVALVAGGALAASALVLGLRKRIDAETATFSMLLGAAASIAALAVIKHYVDHYAAAVSATMPGLLFGWQRLCTNLASRSPDTYLARLTGRVLNKRMAVGVAAVAVLLAAMTCQTAVALMAASRVLSRETALDEATIAKTVDTKAVFGIYRYRVPMRGYAVGFIISYASVPRFTQAYRAGTVFSEYEVLPRKVRINPGYVVMDKQSHAARDGLQELPYQPIDEIYELRTVWLLLRHLPVDSTLNEWQRRLAGGERVLVSLATSACGNVPAPLSCAVQYSYQVAERDDIWCEKVRRVGTDESLGDRCTSDPEKSIITLAGAPFSFNARGEVFFDNRHVGQLQEAPPPNEWQTRLMRGDSARVTLSDSGCETVPPPLVCGAQYLLRLTRKDHRWCEVIHQVGTTNVFAGWCSALLEDSIIRLAGAPFSFNERGEIFHDNRRVGRLEQTPPPNEWQSRFMRGEKVLATFSQQGCGIIPAVLSCPGSYVVTLTENEGRWCETSYQAGSGPTPGMRCNADPDASIFTVIGAPFSYTADGEVLYDRHPVGHLEVPGPSDR